MRLALVEARGGLSAESIELRNARAEAIIWCEAMAAVCRDPGASPEDLEILGNKAVMAAGRVAGFAHLSR